MVPLEIVLCLQSNWSNVTKSAASSMGVWPQKSYHCEVSLCKGTKSPCFSTCCSGLWTCALDAGGLLHEVLLTGNVCTCTGELFSWMPIVVLGGFNGPDRRSQFWFFTLALNCLLFLCISKYLKYIGLTCGCPHLISTHFAEMRHIFCFHHLSWG